MTEAGGPTKEAEFLENQIREYVVNCPTNGVRIAIIEGPIGAEAVFERLIGMFPSYFDQSHLRPFLVSAGESSEAGIAKLLREFAQTDPHERLAPYDFSTDKDIESQNEDFLRLNRLPKIVAAFGHTIDTRERVIAIYHPPGISSASAFEEFQTLAKINAAKLEASGPERENINLVQNVADFITLGSEGKIKHILLRGNAVAPTDARNLTMVALMSSQERYPRGAIFFAGADRPNAVQDILDIVPPAGIRVLDKRSDQNTVQRWEAEVRKSNFPRAVITIDDDSIALFFLPGARPTEVLRDFRRQIRKSMENTVFNRSPDIIN
ncbi:MAG: hypothetical protein COU25_01870 [Candidatus Levybacteria bacterium CG10_big_fil_rev_8_21_14_0_10_35_13]|nr:MAG: hypothetical protein COU25_01870 [Candidatus Levybacteria bacterium CG10_big_fil_rev_8_21_14_0_10_35_13]